MCYKISLIIITTLLLCCSFVNNISAEDTYKIEHPQGLSSFIIVNEDFSIDIRFHIVYSNVLGVTGIVENYFPIPDVGSNEWVLFSTGSYGLATTVNGSILVVTGSIPPYQSNEIVITNHINKLDNNPDDGIYKVEYMSMISEYLTYNKVEVRIPFNKGFNNLELPLKYNFPPDDDKRISDNYVLNWDNAVNEIRFNYTYSFNLVEFVNSHPIMFIIFGVIVGIVFDRIIIKAFPKNKEDKNLRRKHKAKKK